MSNRPIVPPRAYLKPVYRVRTQKHLSLFRASFTVRQSSIRPQQDIARWLRRRYERRLSSPARRSVRFQARRGEGEDWSSTRALDTNTPHPVRVTLKPPNPPQVPGTKKGRHSRLEKKCSKILMPSGKCFRPLVGHQQDICENKKTKRGPFMHTNPTALSDRSNVVALCRT